MKMYVLIRDSVPTGFAVLAAAHASLACYLRFKEAPEIAEWLSGPFRKAVCKVNDKEFEAAKQFEDHVLLTESALDGQEVALAFKPREEWPKPFGFYRLFR
jgi:peptidyl-tRNA hydrolase